MKNRILFILLLVAASASFSCDNEGNGERRFVIPSGSDASSQKKGGETSDEGKTGSKKRKEKDECYDGNDCPSDRPKCVEKGGKRVCVATKQGPVQPDPNQLPETKDDGEACSADTECTSRYCERRDIFGEVGGSCLTFNCNSSKDCASQHGSNNACVSAGSTTVCVRSCERNDECRPKFECLHLGGALNQGVCFPKDNSVSPSGTFPGNSEINNNSDGVKCKNIDANKALEITSTLPAGLTSFTFTAWMKDDNALITPLVIKVADQTLDLRRTQVIDKNIRFAQSVMANGSVLPYMFPLYPSLRKFIRGGEFKTKIQSNKSGKICYRILGETSRGNHIDFNVYLVGAKDEYGVEVTPSSASGDASLQRAFRKIESIYNAHNIHIGTIRYKSLPRDLVERYKIYSIPSSAAGAAQADKELHSLFQRSELPGPSTNEQLSVNLFLVEAIRGQGVLGVSGGIPGAPGLHGLQDSGLLFTSEYLFRDMKDQFGQTVNGADYTGVIMAHEIGHYLGLFHTSEVAIDPSRLASNLQGALYDPLSDTSECPKNNFGERAGYCPDINNLMFPFAGLNHTELSQEQEDVMGASVLTK